MEMPERSTKRPVGWSKPYWARTGLYTAATFVSFLVSLIVVGFLCGVVLRAAIPAQPLVWRVIETALDLLITVAAAWYFASQEGYSKRRYSGKICMGGGLLFLLVQLPVALVVPAAAGPLAATVAELIYFGNQSFYSGSLEPTPPLIRLGCMVAIDLLVVIPTAIVAERVGAKVRQKEIAALIEEAKKLAETSPSESEAEHP